MYVELKNINKNFGDYKASDNVNFGVEKGKLIGLLGPSGSGKTTILRMIAGLETPDSGDIIIDGVRVNDLAASKRGIGFVFQNYALFRYMTVYDNIAFGLRVQKADKKKIDERVRELIKLIGLEGLEKRYPSQLSGGQRQRLSIARAFLKDAPIILMDEATASLDVDNETLIQESLSRLIKNKTVLIIAHRMRTVANADKIVVLKNGKIAESGTPAELMNKGGEYASMVKLQTISQDWAMECHKQHLSNDYLVKFGRLVLHNKTERTDTNDRCDV